MVEVNLYYMYNDEYYTRITLLFFTDLPLTMHIIIILLFLRLHGFGINFLTHSFSQIMSILLNLCKQIKVNI